MLRTKRDGGPAANDPQDQAVITLAQRRARLRHGDSRCLHSPR